MHKIKEGNQCHPHGRNKNNIFFINGVLFISIKSRIEKKKIMYLIIYKWSDIICIMVLADLSCINKYINNI